MSPDAEPVPDPGRTDRLSELYAAHAARLFAYARRHGDAATAEDLVADAFVVALRRPGAVPADPDDARAWLVATVRRLAANVHRREVTRREWWREAVRDGWHARADASAEQVVAERDACLQALAALSETDREAVLLVAWEGLSAAQAAAVLGLSTNAFTVRLHRARRRLAAPAGRAPSPPPAGRAPSPPAAGRAARPPAAERPSRPPHQPTAAPTPTPTRTPRSTR